MIEIFKGLRPFQKAEMLIMMLLAFVIPFSWLAAQYVEVMLLLCAVLKLIFDQKFHLNEDQMKFKWAYIIFALTWVIYLVGMLYTDNQSVGWAQVSKKLGFLIFPVIFIISDMSYLDKTRLKAIGNALVLGCLLYFVINFVYAGYDVFFNGYTKQRFFDEYLMKLWPVHHSYNSMYFALGMVFCFNEIFGDGNRKTKIINGIAYILLVIFIVLASSRAGLLCIVLLFVFQWIWLVFVMKKRKTGLITGCIFIVAMIGAIIAFPNSFSRVTMTIKNVTSEKNSDKRLVQLRGYNEVLTENWLFGVGTGDRSDEIVKSYSAYRDAIIEKIGKPASEAIDRAFAECDKCPMDSIRTMVLSQSEELGFDKEKVNDYLVEYAYIGYAVNEKLNAHNMYFETLISVGILGLLLLLAYFVIPMILWIKSRKIDFVYFSFLIIISFNMLFESIFETQMGIIFFCFFNALLFYSSFVKKVN